MAPPPRTLPAGDPLQLELERGPSAPRLLASFGGAIAGALIAGSVCWLLIEPEPPPDPDADTGYGLELSVAAQRGLCYALGSPLLIAGGATLAGDAMGGQGSYGVAAAGAGISVLAALVATGIAEGAAADRDTTEATAIATFGFLPLLGATVAYALDSAATSRRAERRLQQRSQIVPVFLPIASITDGGRGVSLGARLTF